MTAAALLAEAALTACGTILLTADETWLTPEELLTGAALLDDGGRWAAAAAAPCFASFCFSSSITELLADVGALDGIVAVLLLAEVLLDAEGEDPELGTIGGGAAAAADFFAIGGGAATGSVLFGGGAAATPFAGAGAAP
ncbi:MAG: hypothetical protein HQK53_06330 [Oligoflexia bacterium]|nr:hypothetical protein [Oligoflexia bacterium]